MIELVPTLLRISILGVFVWLAFEDVRTRSCPRWVWYPVVAVGLLALLTEALLTRGTPAFAWTVARLVGSLVLFVPVAGLLYWYPGAGNADAKGVLAVAIAFPTVPLIYGAGTALPVLFGPVVPFSVTVIANALTLAVPMTIALRLADRLDRGVPFLAYLAVGLLFGVFVGDISVLLLRVVG